MTHPTTPKKCWRNWEPWRKPAELSYQQTQKSPADCRALLLALSYDYFLVAFLAALAGAFLVAFLAAFFAGAFFATAFLAGAFFAALFAAFLTAKGIPRFVDFFTTALFLLPTDFLVALPPLRALLLLFLAADFFAALFGRSFRRNLLRGFLYCLFYCFLRRCLFCRRLLNRSLLCRSLLGRSFFRCSFFAGAGTPLTSAGSSLQLVRLCLRLRCRGLDLRRRPRKSKC